MRLLVTALIAAALVVPTTALAGASSSAGSAAHAALAKKHKKKKQRQTRAAKTSSATARSGKKNAASGEREVRGTITSLGSGTVTVGAVSCAVPSAFSLGAFAVGDLVEINCTLVGGAWTLRKIEREDAAVTGTKVEVKGAIGAIGGGSVTVNTTTCAIPTGAVLAGFAVGDVVEMKCRTVAGVLTLEKLKAEDDDHASGSEDEWDDDDHSGSDSGHEDDEHSGSGSEHDR